MLSLTRYPAAQQTGQPVLVIVHGLFGSGRNWGVIARHLADTRDTVTVDQRNHGASPRAISQSYADMADDLAEVIATLPGTVDVLGHSMGGKAAMMLALTHPAMIRRLVVADIAPVAYSHDQTRHIDAMRGLDLTNLTLRSEADRRLSSTIPDAALRAFFLQSLDLQASPPRWRLNLDVLKAEMPNIVGWPDVTGTFPGAVLFLSGANSPYVQPDHREGIRVLFPESRFSSIAGAGHWLHAEKPREFEQAVRAFLTAPD